jgi:hypothetical protein
MSDKKINRRLSIFINGITRAVRTTTNQLNALDASSETYDEDVQRLSAKLKILTEQQAAFRAELHGTTNDMGAAKGAFSNIFNGIKSGDFIQVQEGFRGIKGGVTETIQSFKAFIATPIGAAIAVLVGIGLAAKKLHEYNLEMTVFNSKLGALGIAAEDLPIVRSEIMATAEAYNKTFDEIAQKAASLSVSFGISMSEANDVIARGLAMGGSQNDEFLDSLGEYDEFFAKAGYSAQNFIDILNEGPKLGIYSDKLPDAIKEANLAIEEQTVATRDALVNAFGSAFTDSILSRVKSGAISTKDALQEIAAEASKVGLNAQQAAQLTADVFKGAGEDAGGALKVLKAIGQATKKELDEAATASEELRKANEALSKTNAELFEIEGYGNMWTKMKTLGVEAWNFLLKSQAQYVNTMASLPKRVANAFIAIYNYSLELAVKLTETVAPVLDALGVNVEKLEKKIQSLKAKKLEITPVFNLDADKAVTENIASSEAVRTERIKAETEKRIKLLTQQKERMAALGKDTYNIERQLLQEQQKLYAKNSDEYTKIANQLLKLKTDHNAKLEKAGSKKTAQDDKEAKAEEERLKKVYTQQMSVAKANLDLYIANNQSKINDETRLTQQVIDEEVKRLDGIKQAKLDALEVEKRTSDEVIAIKRQSNIALSADDLEYLAAKQNYEVENVKATEALKKQAKEQDKQRDLEQAQIDYELSLANAETTEEEERLRREKAYKDEKDRYKKLFEEKKITAGQFTAFVDKLDRDQKAAERSRELQRVGENLGALNNLAGAVGTLFGQSKELALAQAAINGAMAITSILAQMPKFDGGFMVAAAIATAVATTAAQIKEIQKQKPPKRAKFFDGGYTGTDVKYPDEYGGVTQVNEFHGNEWVMPEVMLRQPRYANVAGWLERERKAPGSAGALPGTGTAGDNAGSAVATAALIDVVATLNATLQGGIKATTHVGYKQVRDINKMNEEITASGANGKTNTP